MPSLLEHLQQSKFKPPSSSSAASDRGTAGDPDAAAVIAGEDGNKRGNVRTWLGAAPPGSGEIKLDQDKKDTLWRECSSARAADCVTVENAITSDECVALINLWKAQYEGPDAEEAMRQLDSVDGLPTMQRDIDSPVLATLANGLIDHSRLANLWAAASRLPIAAADDTGMAANAEVPWDSQLCSAFVRRYTNGVRQSIKWHADAAAYTINIALNDAGEYSGGQLTAMIGGSMHTLHRARAGSATVHGCNVLHTVKPVESGERFSLIIFVRKEGGIELRRKWSAWQQKAPLPLPVPPTPPSAPSRQAQPQPPLSPNSNSKRGGRGNRSSSSFEKQLLTYATQAWEHTDVGQAWVEDAPSGGYRYLGQASDAGRPVRVVRLRQATLIGYEGLLIQPGPKWTFKMASSSNGPAGVVPPRPSRELLAEELTRALVQIVPEEVLPAGGGAPLRVKGSAVFFSHICQQCRVPLAELTSDVLLFDELRKFGASPGVSAPRTIRNLPPRGPCVSLIGQYSLNYYHFLMKAAPSLVAALRFVDRAAVRVVTYETPHALELCALLGLSADQLVLFRPNELLLAEGGQMHCVVGLNPSTDFPSRATVAQLRDAVLPCAPSDGSGGGSGGSSGGGSGWWWSSPAPAPRRGRRRGRVRVLLLNRRGQATRVLSEGDQSRVEDVVRQHFASRGGPEGAAEEEAAGEEEAFELLAPARWPPPGVVGGQHALFSAADVVIGPHGAALANCVWMKRGAVLVELRPSIRRGWLSVPGNDDAGEYELLSSLAPGVRYVKAPVPGGWDTKRTVIDAAAVEAIERGLSLVTTVGAHGV